MLVATAGHIDHGKSSLVRAITGVETDRLQEEKRRGISIDLGFAYWRPDGVPTIGFIDVPGHERFVRNMLAGVVGIDAALLVVAADDGVMPQTREHLEILDILGVSQGVVAITKTDRVAHERLEEVRGQVTELLDGTALAGATTFDVSTATGDGVAELSSALIALAAADPSRAVVGRGFRMAIDRAFSVTGAGTVVAGTVLQGALKSGERLVLSPRGAAVRVRGLQSGGRSVERVEAGQRCAVNLAGVELSQVHRGDWLMAADLNAPTSRLEVEIEVSADGGKPLKHNAQVHLHHGTADIGARVLTPRQASVAPGGRAVVTLALETPTSAVNGERFVLRDPSGRRTLGGGRVLDPFASERRRRGEDRAPILAALGEAEPAAALATLLAIPGYELDTDWFARTFNLEPSMARELYDRAGAVRLAQGLALPAVRARALQDAIVDAVKASHRAKPDAEGVPPRDLEALGGERLSPPLLQALLKSLVDAGRLERVGVLAKAPGHRGALSAGDAAAWGKLVPWLQERGPIPFTAAEAAKELRTSEVLARALLSRKAATREVWRFAGERLLLGDQVASLVARADELTKAGQGEGFTAAAFRDATGIPRNTVIRMLEFFDSIAVTSRQGDRRKVRANYQRVVGSAPPFDPSDHREGTR
jgi:selenocysteine-specific elongation factor